ncbi:hypothetical protein NC651_007835 [Populus alba x Populus x berolinensis]|nr:hypothetical protein NC651_007835 [Populus alba x Populus x berolinensis]
MENEERAHLEAHYQRELENMKNDIARLTSLLEQALVSKSGEGTSTQPAVATPSISMPAAPIVFTSQNLGSNPSSFEQQFTANVPLAQGPVNVNLATDGPQRMKFSENIDYDKLTALEERLKAVEGADLYDPKQQQRRLEPPSTSHATVAPPANHRLQPRQGTGGKLIPPVTFYLLGQTGSGPETCIWARRILAQPGGRGIPAPDSRREIVSLHLHH